MNGPSVTAAILLSCSILPIACAAPEPLTDEGRMAALVRFADTVLEHGRDTYGEKHTPLFIDYIDVSTLKAPEKMYITRLGGPGPRSKQPYQPVVMSNLAHQGNLSRFLVGLSNLTDDSRYKDAYKNCLRYYFEHYAVPNGLLHMGHHRWVNVKTDHYDGDDWPSGKSGHELKRDYPYYPIYWEADPVETRRMLTAHWTSHIQDWSFMNFTRHGSYVKELNEKAAWSQPVTEPVKGIVPGNLTFFDSGSDIIWAGAQLGLLNGDDRPLFWTQRLYARYAESAHPDTGLPPWHHTSMRDFGTKDYPVPEYALISRGTRGLLGNGGIAMLRIGEDLGEKGKYYRETMLSHLKAYAKWLYIPEKNLLRNFLIDGTDLAEREKKKRAETGETGPNPWQPWEPDPTTITAYAICYRQSRDADIWATLRAMCRGNDLGDIGEIGGREPKLHMETTQTNTRHLFTLIEIYRATDNPAYLELCRRIANNAVSKHFRPDQGLFTPTELHRTANLCSVEPLALLTLEAALRGKLSQVPTYAGSNEAEQKPYIRPLKFRPWTPSVSHLHYPDCAEAMCDDLYPGSSGGGGAPVMSWANVRKPTDEAIASFPDVLDGPATITGLNDHPEARNSLSGMIIDSHHSYTFAGNLNGTGDLAIDVSKGEHRWAPGSHWTTTNWSPTETYDLVLDVAKDAKFAFHGLVQEVNHAHRWGRGAGIIKKGEGVAELTANNSPLYQANLSSNRSYRASTVVNDGLLLVNNTEGSGVSPRSTVEVNHGGTLGGNGAIGDGGTSAVVVVNAGGKIDPGDGIGTLTLRDGLILRDGARLEFEVGETSDLLKITGGTFQGCQRGGTVITMRNRGGIARGKSFVLIDWTGASYVDVDVSDFRLDKSQDWQGSFHFDGTKLKFNVFAPRLTPETPIPMPPKPTAAPKKPLPAELVMPVSHFTWSNPKGGDWTDSANWNDGKIPNTKNPEWAQYQFETPRTISGVEVYWLDNGRDRKIPESWRVLYHDGGEWKAVTATGEYGLETNRFNEVQFEPVETDRLRLEVMLQPGISAGIQEWRNSS